MSNQKSSSIIVPATPSLINISENLILARLNDGVLILLDSHKKKAVKIHGGEHNNSPCELARQPLNLDGYKFSFEKKDRALKVWIEDDRKWKRACKVSGTLRDARLKFDNKKYSVVLISFVFKTNWLKRKY